MSKLWRQAQCYVSYTSTYTLQYRAHCGSEFLTPPQVFMQKCGGVVLHQGRFWIEFLNYVLSETSLLRTVLTEDQNPCCLLHSISILTNYDPRPQLFSINWY